MLTQLHWLENLTADPGPFEVSPLLAADIDALNARTLTPSLKTNFEAAAGITLSASFAVYVVKSTEWIIYDPVATAKAYICTQHGTPNNYHLDCQRVMNFYLVEDFHDGDGYCIYSKDWWDIPYVRPRAIRLFGGAGADELPTTEEMNICSTREYDTADGRDYYFTARSGVYQPPIPGPHLILVPIPYDAIVLHGRILRNIAIGPMGVVEDDMGPEGVPNYYQDYDWELEEDVIVSDDFPVVITRPAGCDSMLGYALIYNHSTTHTFPTELRSGNTASGRGIATGNNARRSSGQRNDIQALQPNHRHRFGRDRIHHRTRPGRRHSSKQYSQLRYDTGKYRGPILLHLRCAIGRRTAK
jgi:hypothetical protein